MNKKIIISLSVIIVVAAIVIGATTAFFSDTETSTGNTFTAGAIDLKIDNKSYVTNSEGVLVASPDTSWTLANLDDPCENEEACPRLFFNFTDLKPGDLGEDTISLHVNSNDAWACMNILITETPENSITEPESEVDQTPDVGELQNELRFAFWADDGDNVYETGEYIFKQGIAGEIFDGSSWALADSETNVWEGSNVPLTGEITYHVGKVWCYGNLEENPVSEDEGDPITRGTTGFTCDGQPVNNASQTDGIKADVTFYAEQSRNNADFVCSQARTKTLILENKNPSTWEIITDEDPIMRGILTYSVAGDEFNYSFTASGLQIDTSYSLIYYADNGTRFENWGGNNPGALIDTFTTTGSGNIPSTSGSINLGMDLPDPNDWNATADPDYCNDSNNFDHYNTCTGAKIWLVPSIGYDASAKALIGWNPTTYLFETDLIIYNDTN